MTDAERFSRENFYQNMVWVVDARSFAENFDLYHLLPDPKSDIAKDIVWVKAKRHLNGANGGIFFRLSEALNENPAATKKDIRGGWYHFIHEIEEQVNASYRGHHQYDWVRPRQTWLSASVPVYLDFGKEWLARLETYDESDLRCVRLISKRKFIHDLMTETEAGNIASRFYPIAGTKACGTDISGISWQTT